MLPVEIWWHIARLMHTAAWRKVCREVNAVVVLADPDSGLLQARLGRSRHGIQVKWHRHTTLLDDIHLCNWGLWKDGHCRHYTAMNLGYWVGDSYVIYKNIFYMSNAGRVDRQIREVQSL